METVLDATETLVCGPKHFEETSGKGVAYPQRKGRLNDRYGLFNPLDTCIELFQHLSDAEAYANWLENRGKEGYTIRMMRPSRDGSPIAVAKQEEAVTLRWYPEVDEEGRDVYYKPYMSSRLRQDLPVDLNYADYDLLISPYSCRN